MKRINMLSFYMLVDFKAPGSEKSKMPARMSFEIIGDGGGHLISLWRKGGTWSNRDSNT